MTIEYEWNSPGKLPAPLRDDRVISSVRLIIGAAHTYLRVWNRGILAGELCIDGEDWPTFVSAFGFDPQEGRKL